MRSLGIGFGLGFFVAAQIGPMSLFLIRSTLRGSLAVGLAIGAGIAATDMLYASVGAAGAAPVLAVDELRMVLGLVGAAVLVTLGLRTLWSAFRVRMGGESVAETRSPRRAFVTAIGATASNPLTIASWAAIFAAASTAGATGSAGATVALLLGVGLGSLTCVTALAVGAATARRALGDRTLRIVDVCAGLALLGFGGALAVRSVDHR